MTEFEKKVSQVLLDEEFELMGFKKLSAEEIDEIRNGEGTADNPYTMMPEPRIYKEG